jgi:beta-lactamase class A
MMSPRRIVLVLLLTSARIATPETLDDLQRRIQQIASSLETSRHESVGVSIRHAESGVQVAFNGDTPFTMASVVKYPIGVELLRQVEEKRLRLDQRVLLNKEDLRRGHSPIAQRYPNGGASLLVSELLEFMVADSDNTACDLILRLVGGPPSLDRRLHAFGIRGISVHRSEGELMPVNYDPTPAQWDTATPRAMTDLLARTQRGELLQSDATAHLLKLMTNTRTPERLRAGLPPGVAVAHKTGTAPGVVVNDVGVIGLPGGGGHVAVAVFTRSPSRDAARQEQVIAEIARAAYRHWVPESRIGDAGERTSK